MSSYLVHSSVFIIQLSTVEFVYHYYLDVSELLFPEVHSCDYIQSINSSASSIILPNWTCNDYYYTIFDFSYEIFTWLEFRRVLFRSLVLTFQIDGLNRLNRLKIGKNSFTQAKNDLGLHPWKSFHILNCESLESIQIGQYSFSDYSGEFELKNLTQLQSIQMAMTGGNSYNFYSGSFEIGGIELILNIVMNRSSKSTIHYFRQWCIPI